MPVPAQLDEVAWVCEQCGTGLLLDEEDGLHRLELNTASGIKPNAKGRPFWVVRGSVTLDRDTYGVLGKQTGKAQKFWSEPRLFFIPAYSCSIDELTKLGMHLLTNPPELKPGLAADFLPVTLHKEDIRAYAEFIIMGIEAQRKDMVKEVAFTLQLEQAVLWVLP
jgi:hypothetical protein